MEVGAGDDVASGAVGAHFDGVEGNAVAGVFGVEVLGFAQAWGPQGFRLAGRAVSMGARAHLVGGVGIEAADGARAGAWELVLRGEWLQQQVQLFLAEVGVSAAQAADLGDDRRRPLAPTALLGGGRARDQRGGVAAFLAQMGAPGEQGAPADPERFLGGRQAVPLPKAKDFQPSLGALRDHAPAQGVIGEPVEPANLIADVPQPHRTLPPAGSAICFWP